MRRFRDCYNKKHRQVTYLLAFLFTFNDHFYFFNKQSNAFNWQYLVIYLQKICKNKGHSKTSNKCGCNYIFKILSPFSNNQIVQYTIRPLDSFMCINDTQCSWYIEKVCFSQQIIIGIFIY